MEIKWVRGRTLNSPKMMQDVAATLGCVLPEDYIRIAMRHNGAKPIPGDFAAGGQEYTFERLLPVNEDASFTVADAMQALRGEETGLKLYPFGIDPEGNMLCFHYSGMQAYRVVLYLHETGEPVMVADTFTDLLEMLGRDE